MFVEHPHVCWVVLGEEEEVVIFEFGEILQWAEDVVGVESGAIG